VKTNENKCLSHVTNDWTRDEEKSREK
jgi:hypothetical protein